MLLLRVPHAVSKRSKSSKEPQITHRRHLCLPDPKTSVIPNISGSQVVSSDLRTGGWVDGDEMAAATGAVTVSVEVTALAPGISDDGENPQVGIGDGPFTTQES